MATKKACCDDGEIEAKAAPTQSADCVSTPVCHTPQTVTCNPCADTTIRTQPYYQKANLCPQDNIKYVKVEKLVGAFTNISGFCMPACGAKVRVTFQNVGDVPIGAWLWAYGLGYLTITNFNPITQEIELQNDCPDTLCAGQIQAAPGTPIPACTVFVLTAPTCSDAISSSTNLTFPYLNAGFTAPDSGDCIDVTVTNVNGISVNKNVTINGGTYRVSSINSGTNLTICNDGAGLTPGIVVEYKDNSGNLIVPIVLIDSNPCTNTAQFSGKPLACINNVIVPIVGTENGQVLVYDSETGNANFRTLGLPVLDCTELTACLTLDPNLPSGTAYVVQVADTSLFSPTDVVTIGVTQFTVDSIVNATTMRIIPVADPTAIQTYNAGAILCTGDCCTTLNVTTDSLASRIDDLENSIENNVADCGQRNDIAVGYQVSTAITPSDIDGLTTTIDGNIASLTITNNSCVNVMHIHYAITYGWTYDIYGAPGDFQDVGRFGEYAVDANPLAATGLLYDLPDSAAIGDIGGTGYNRYAESATYTGVQVIPASTSITIQAKATMSFNAGGADHINVKDLSATISYIAVALLP